MTQFGYAIWQETPQTLIVQATSHEEAKIIYQIMII